MHGRRFGTEFGGGSFLDQISEWPFSGKSVDVTLKNFFCLSLLSEIWNRVIVYLFDLKLLFHHPKFLLKTFFSQFVLCLTSNNSSSRNIGDGRMGRPPPQICEDLSPRPSKSTPVHGLLPDIGFANGFARLNDILFTSRLGHIDVKRTLTPRIKKTLKDAFVF